MAELLSTALEVLSAIKECYDTMKENQEAVSMIVARANTLKQPPDIQENTRPYPSDTNNALVFLIGVLKRFMNFQIQSTYLLAGGYAIY